MSEDYIAVYIYPDGEVYDEPPEWKSDDYIIRYTTTCEHCGEQFAPEYAEPFAHCACGTSEWYK